MPTPITKTHCLSQVYSPFSGMPADGDDGPNEKDPTLLFVWYGCSGQFEYISERLQTVGGEDFDDVSEVCKAIDIKGAIVLEVDTDWNGINYYGFAPTE
jgi:hypothetical protein